MVIDLTAKIRISVTLDERKCLVFRAFQQISAGLTGIPKQTSTAASAQTASRHFLN